MAKIICELPLKLRENTANEISEPETREEISDWLDAWLDRYEVLLEERIRQLEVVLDKAPDSVNYDRIADEVEETHGSDPAASQHVSSLGDMPPPRRRDDSAAVRPRRHASRR
jgi:hypothetical protein